jgi:hypothetical protein
MLTQTLSKTTSFIKVEGVCTSKMIATLQNHTCVLSLLAVINYDTRDARASIQHATA